MMYIWGAEWSMVDHQKELIYVIVMRPLVPNWASMEFSYALSSWVLNFPMLEG